MGGTNKRIKVLFITALAVLAVILVFKRIILPTEPWYQLSRQYVDLKPPEMGHFHFHDVALASNPGNFSADMSDETYSDSLIFYSDHDFQHSPGSGITKLPFPPKEVYCVVGEFGLGPTIFFFVALHSDGQHEAWVVHTHTGFWKGIRSLMDRIGCDIPSY